MKYLKTIMIFLIFVAGFYFYTNAVDAQAKSILEIDKSVLENALFIGDSYTEKLNGLQLKEKYKARIWAGGGYTATDLLAEINLHSDENPSKIILLVGINDLYFMQSIEEINPTKEEQLIDYLVKIYHVPIYVQLVFPVGKALLNVKPVYSLVNINTYNESLKKFCEKNGYDWIDTHDGFVDEEGYLKYTDDYLHIDDEHYTDYLNNIALSVAAREKQMLEDIK